MNMDSYFKALESQKFINASLTCTFLQKHGGKAYYIIYSTGKICGFRLAENMGCVWLSLTKMRFFVVNQITHNIAPQKVLL